MGKTDDFEGVIRVSRRYERTGKLKYLEEAIRVSRRAVEITPSDHPGLASKLYNLGATLGYLYERTEKMEDLEEAIRTSRQAVDVTLDDHPDLAVWWKNLGKLASRYERLGTMGDLEEAIRVSHLAVKFTPALSFIRLRATHQALQLLQERGVCGSAYTLSKEAIDLLPHVRNTSLYLFLNELEPRRGLSWPSSHRCCHAALMTRGFKIVGTPPRSPRQPPPSWHVKYYQAYIFPFLPILPEGLTCY
jgi:tetratricopeptide (TPR) repeat protein